MKLKQNKKLNNKKLQKAQHLFGQAIKCHQMGQLQQAQQLYQDVLAINPCHADSLHSLGLIIADAGNLPQALDLITQAIACQSKFAPYYLNRSIVCKRMSKYDEAIADLLRAINLDPKMWLAYFNLGELYAATERPNDAINSYQKSIQLNPSYINSYNNLGNVYLLQENYHAAIEHYQKVLQFDANCVEAISNLGAALHGLKKHDEAIECCQRALQKNDRYVSAYINWSLILTDLGRFAEALAKYQKILELDPNNVEFYSNLGNCYKEQGEIKKALECYQRALLIKPDDPKAQFNLAITQLLIGDFANGWQNYESRFALPERKRAEYHFSQPVWRGQSLEHKTLFIHVEQGLGDTLQFVRYLSLINNDEAEIILESQPELLTLLQNQFKNIKVIPRCNPPQHFDYHIALMSLPFVFHTEMDSIPFSDGYIKIEKPVKSAAWLKQNRKLNVGIVWGGGSLHKNDKNRSIRLQQFVSLFNNKNVNFYSLQMGDKKHELQSCEFSSQIEDLSPHIHDFVDTANILIQLDLLISVDTAIAHLAGAIGVRCWLLVSFIPDFRWLLNRDDSLWYRSVQLFRQTSQRNWEEVIELMSLELKKVHQSSATNFIQRFRQKVFKKNNK